MRKKDEMYGFQKFKTMQSFAKNISNRVLTPDYTIDDPIILKKKSTHNLKKCTLPELEEFLKERQKIINFFLK